MEPKDEIRERLNIAEVIGSYVDLKPAGAGSSKGLCPFHGEKSPSFYVSEEKEIWHCFGCDKGGDIYSFVMDMEGMSFPEALRLLGKKAGVEIPEFRSKKTTGEEEALKALHQVAGNIYEKLLWEHEGGKVAKEYLERRGIPEDLAKKFRLGFAPDSWDALSSFLRKKGYRDEQLVKAGLAKRKRSGTGVIDQFRNRLLIPLCDIQGNIVGFTGRTLAEDGDGPKYLNTPETPIYHKSKVLFGLDVAKMATRKEKAVVIVEGNLDVVASHKAGIEHVVASSGTALTEDQLRLLSKFTRKLLFCFDADAAGFAAAQRGIRLAQAQEFDVLVISIPEEDGKDPDDVVQKNEARWRELVANPIPIMQYYFDRALKEFDVTSAEGKKQFVHFLLSELARVTDTVEREHWLQKMSDVVHVELAVLRDVLGKKRGEIPKPVTRNTPQPSGEPRQANITSREEQAAAFLVGLMLLDEEMTEEVAARIEPEMLPEEPWGRVYKELILLYTQKDSSDSTQKSLFSRAHESFDESNLRLLRASVLRAQELLRDLPREHVREEFNRHLNLLSAASAEQKRKQLLSAIREAERLGDTGRLTALMEQYTKFIKK